MAHPACIPTDDLLRDCEVVRTRRSGPGGQHRNKVETAVVVEHRPTGLRAEASERRSQVQNKAEAVRRLRLRLALEVRTERNEPSEMWRSRCSGGRVAINPKHEDYPAMLAEALDVIAMCDADVAAAAQRLTCSTSQLVKLLRHERRALEQVNVSRAERDLSPLK